MSAADTLIAKLRREDPSVRRQALRELGELGDERAVQSIVPLLDDPDGFVFVAAVRALGQIGGPTVIRALVEALVEMDRYVDPHEPGPHSSDYIEKALCRIGPPAIPELLKALYNDAWIGSGRTGRWRAAWALGRMKNPTAVPGLLRALSEVGDDVRRSVALALGYIGDRRAVPGLVNTLREDASGRAREWAADSLGRIGDPAAVPQLVEAGLTDPNRRVRGRSAVALKAIGDQAAVPGLIRMLKDSDSWVASRAADALQSIGTTEALAAVGAWRH